MKRIGVTISGTIVIVAGLIGLYYGILTLDDLSTYSGTYAFVGVLILAFALPVAICGISAIKPYIGVIRNKKNPAMSLVLLRGSAIVVGLLLIAVGCFGVVGESWVLISAGVVYFHFQWAIKDFHTSADETEEAGKPSEG